MNAAKIRQNRITCLSDSLILRRRRTPGRNTRLIRPGQARPDHQYHIFSSFKSFALSTRLGRDYGWTETRQIVDWTERSRICGTHAPHTRAKLTLRKHHLEQNAKPKNMNSKLALIFLYMPTNVCEVLYNFHIQLNTTIIHYMPLQFMCIPRDGVHRRYNSTR